MLWCEDSFQTGMYVWSSSSTLPYYVQYSARTLILICFLGVLVCELNVVLFMGHSSDIGAALLYFYKLY